MQHSDVESHQLLIFARGTYCYLYFYNAIRGTCNIDRLQMKPLQINQRNKHTSDHVRQASRMQRDERARFQEHLL